MIFLKAVARVSERSELRISVRYSSDIEGCHAGGGENSIQLALEPSELECSRSFLFPRVGGFADVWS